MLRERTIRLNCASVWTNEPATAGNLRSRMTTVLDLNPSLQETIAPIRLLADQAFSRAAGAPLVPGNEIRLLRDAVENYPAWQEAIRSAKRTIHF